MEKFDFSNNFLRLWRQNNPPKKKQHKEIVLGRWALVICRIMFISYSLKQVADDLWRITFWIIPALSEAVWNGFTARLSVVDAISYKMQKSSRQYGCIYIYLSDINNKQGEIQLRRVSTL